jgi:hypothetical protein
VSYREWITSSDVTTLVAQDFNLSGCIAYANNDVEIVGYSLGVDPTGIAYPLHQIVKGYAVESALCNLFLDKVGTNNIDTSQDDKYFTLYKIHEDKRQTILKSLTPEIMANVADTPNEFASFTVLSYRGS